MPVTAGEISQLWRHVNREMREVWRSTVETYDFPPMTFWLLRNIAKEPGITVSELSRRVGAAKSHTSNLIDQLVQAEYVEKQTDSSDQRIFRLYLLDSAERLLGGVDERMEEVWAEVCAQFAPGELEQIERSLCSLLDALQRANEQTQPATPRPAAAEVAK